MVTFEAITRHRGVTSAWEPGANADIEHIALADHSDLLVVAPATADLIARTDEIGIAERELASMQHELRAALTQKTRLATLGAAVAKVNHDLRNTLATSAATSRWTTAAAWSTSTSPSTAESGWNPATTIRSSAWAPP